MRRLLIAIAATALLATPVMAQPYGSGPGPGPGPGAPGPGYGAGPGAPGPGPGAPGPGPGPGPGYGPGAPEYRRDGDRRMNNRGGNSWRRHVRACSARYRTYNPRTDRYVVRRGVTARCRL